jgi:hypothetical protein
MKTEFLNRLMLVLLFVGQLVDTQAQSTFQFDANGNLTNVASIASGPPTITAPPVTEDVILGGDAAFSVAALGAEPLTYQWYDNGVAIPSGTNSTLFFQNLTMSNQGAYSVVVCNSSGCVTSTVPAQLVFDCTWVGGVSGDWYDAANWFPGSVPTGAENITVSGATVDLSASVTITGTLTCSEGTSLTNDVLTVGKGGTVIWSGGEVLPSSVNVQSNGMLVLAGTNGAGYQLHGVWTNAGTIELASGNLVLDSQQIPGVAELVNLPGGILDAATNVSIENYLGNEVLLNEGTLAMTGASSVGFISAILINGGLVEAEAGTIKIEGGGSSSNCVFEAGPGALLQFEGNYTANGGTQFAGVGSNVITGTFIVNGPAAMTNVVFNGLTMTLNGNISGSNLVLESGTCALNGTLTGTNLMLAGATFDGSNGVIAGGLTWTAGQLASGSVLTAASNALLILEGDSQYIMRGVLTNAGTIDLVNGNIALNSGNTAGQGQLINLPGAVVNIMTNVSINNAFNNEVLVNEGTIEKTGGTGTTVISPIFTNSGILNAQTGTISVNGSYTLTGGALDIGISGTTSYGVVHFSGSAPLNGVGLNVNLENGFLPAISNFFAIVTYGSKSGVFNTPNLPLSVLWQTNYGSTAFSLTVLGIRPVLIPSLVTNGTAHQLPEFQLQFTGSTNNLYTVLGTTNLGLPFSNWIDLGNASLVSGNLFQFTDTNSTNFKARFYMLQSP